MPLPLTTRFALLSLVIASVSGCASSSTQQPNHMQERRPVVQLQDPDQTPREKWSDAMVILRKDMGIEGQSDIPREQFDNAVLQASQRRGESTGSTIETGGVAMGAAGYLASPTGFSAAGALGAGLALGFLTAAPGPGPAQNAQVAAWVPSHLAADMNQAIEIALSTYNGARQQVFPKAVRVDLKGSRYPMGTPAGRLYSGFGGIAKREPVKPEGGATEAPTFLPPGKYYGPIFFYDSQYQFIMDTRQNKTTRPEAMLSLSKILPEWFVLYHKGVRPQRGIDGEPPLVFNKGQALPFVGK